MKHRMRPHCQGTSVRQLRGPSGLTDVARGSCGPPDLGPQPGHGEVGAEGLSPHGWGNGPGDTYGWHEHGYEKVLYCVRGRIVFHTEGGDVELGSGDKLILPPHTAHAATVGAQGVRCIEAPRQRG